MSTSKPPAGPLEAVPGGTQEGLEASAAPPRSPPVDTMGEVYLLRYWLLRAYKGRQREGWEEGPTEVETFDRVLDVLCNIGLDPTKLHGAADAVLAEPEWYAPDTASNEPAPKAPPKDSPSQGERPDFPRLDPVAVKYAGDALDRIATDAKEHPHRAAFNRIAHWLWQVSGAEPFDPPASQGERKQQLLDQDRAPAAHEHVFDSQLLCKTCGNCALDLAEVAQAKLSRLARKARERAAEYHSEKPPKKTGPRCFAKTRKGNPCAMASSTKSGLCMTHAANAWDRFVIGNARVSAPSGPSSASLESGGGTLETIGAATRETTNPEER